MVAMQAYLVSIYQAELRREADGNRLAFDDTLSGEVRYAGRLPDGRPAVTQPASGPDPRRALARVAASVSRAAAGTARWLDPSVDDGVLRRRASGAAGR